MHIALPIGALLLACGGAGEGTDAGADRVLCVVRGAHIEASGCRGPERAFAETFVAPAECLHTSEERCVAALPDSGLAGAWLFSGDYFEGISNTAPCDAQTLAGARAAPACDSSAQCVPCDADAGTLCALAPPCP